jgi:hypothetical protein
MARHRAIAAFRKSKSLVEGIFERVMIPSVLKQDEVNLTRLGVLTSLWRARKDAGGDLDEYERDLIGTKVRRYFNSIPRRDRHAEIVRALEPQVTSILSVLREVDRPHEYGPSTDSIAELARSISVDCSSSALQMPLDMDVFPSGHGGGIVGVEADAVSQHIGAIRSFVQSRIGYAVRTESRPLCVAQGGGNKRSPLAKTTRRSVRSEPAPSQGCVGVFLEGFARAGSVVAMVPGKVYRRADAATLAQRYGLSEGGPPLDPKVGVVMRRWDGDLLDAGGAIFGPKRPNLFAVGDKVRWVGWDGRGDEEVPNVVACAFDFAYDLIESDTSAREGLLEYVPNRFFWPAPGTSVMERFDKVLNFVNKERGRGKTGAEVSSATTDDGPAEALPRDAKGRSVEFCGPEDLGGLRGAGDGCAAKGIVFLALRDIFDGEELLWLPQGCSAGAVVTGDGVDASRVHGSKQFKRVG